MKKNVGIYNAIDKALLNGKKVKYREIDSVVRMELGEGNYTKRQLSNALYHLVRRGVLRRNEAEEYYMEGVEMPTPRTAEKQTIPVPENMLLDNYLEKMLKICLEEEKKLRNPFDKFQDDTIILEAKRVYEINKKFLAILREEEAKIQNK